MMVMVMCILVIYTGLGPYIHFPYETRYPRGGMHSFISICDTGGALSWMSLRIKDSYLYIR
jgi:hypothetical protein